MRSTPNNGVYLCTWLYRKDGESTPIWLDRYYYPDVIDRKIALTEEVYQPSFENNLDKNYTKDKDFKDFIFKQTYIDKVSDLVIEPANSYLFQRLSSSMV